MEFGEKKRLPNKNWAMNILHNIISLDMLRRFNLNNVVVLPWALLFKRKTPCALPLSSIPTWKGWTPYRFSKGYRHKPVKYRLLWLINKINLLTIVAIDLRTKCSVTVAMILRFSENKKDINLRSFQLTFVLLIY